MKFALVLFAAGGLLGLAQVQSSSGTAASSHRGTLLDAPCAASINVKAGPADTGLVKPLTGAPSADGSSPRPAVGTDAPRASAELIPCQATRTSTEFALRMDNGQIVRFDSTSNGKVLQAIAADERWKDVLNTTPGLPGEATADRAKPTAGRDVTGSGTTKPAGTSRRVVVAGARQGDMLRVDSIELEERASAPLKR